MSPHSRVSGPAPVVLCQWRLYLSSFLLAERISLPAAFVVAAFAFFVSPGLLESLDYVLFYQPNFHFLGRCLADHVLPLWNPHVGLGRPFLADLQMAVFYPPVYLVCFGEQGVFLLVFLHCGLAIIGARRLALHLGANAIHSTLAAICLVASLGVTSRFYCGQILYACALCYLPLLIILTIRQSECWCPRRVAIHAGTAALQLLCGHPQVFWFSILAQALFVVGWAGSSSLRDSARRLWQAGAPLSLALAISGLLAGIVLLPFLELVQQGNRAESTRQFAAFGKLLPTDLFGLFTYPPGDGAINWEYNLFLGTPMVLTGLAGLMRLGDRNIRGLWSIVFGSLAVSFADQSPIFSLLYNYLPGYANLRVHARMGVAIPLLLGLASSVWLTKASSSRYSKIQLIVACMLMLLPLVIYYPHRNSAGGELSLVLPAASISIAAALAWLFLWSQTNGTKRTLLPLAGLVALQLFEVIKANVAYKNAYSFAATTGNPSAFPLANELTGACRDAGFSKTGPPPRVSVPPELVPHNAGMMLGTSSHDGYVSLFLKRPWDYLHITRGITPPVERNTSLDPDTYRLGTFPFPETGTVIGFDGVTRRLVGNPNPPPRAFLLYQASQPMSKTEILKTLKLTRCEGQAGLVEAPLAADLSDSSPPKPANILEFSPNSLLIETDSHIPALLVLREAWYPGWRAAIGNELQDSFPVNYWMRGFIVPAGRHQVRVYFHQNYLLLGAGLTLLGLGLLVCLYTRGVQRSAIPKSDSASSSQGAQPR